MEQEDFLKCCDFEKWAEILGAREPYLPEAADAAYVETTTNERNKLYQATGLVLTRRALQVYRLRLEAKGYDWTQEITRWSLPLSSVTVETKGVANDWGMNDLEELEYGGLLKLDRSLGELGDEIALPVVAKSPLQRRVRDRLRSFFDAIALAIE